MNSKVLPVVERRSPAFFVRDIESDALQRESWRSENLLFELAAEILIARVADESER
jgi:hypothetical protein